MQISMLSTPGSNNGLYPDFIGKRSVFVGTGTGPATYNSTTGDPVTVNFSPFYIDLLFGGILDTTGAIFAIAKPAGTGTRQTWALFYYTASTGAPVANNSTAVAGKVFQLGGIGGQF